MNKVAYDFGKMMGQLPFMGGHEEEKKGLMGRLGSGLGYGLLGGLGGAAALGLAGKYIPSFGKAINSAVLPGQLSRFVGGGTLPGAYKAMENLSKVNPLFYGGLGGLGIGGAAGGMYGLAKD